MSTARASFASEADLCATFIKQMEKGWTCYPETAGFDILLIRKADGAQVGVEAKMTLNAKVIEQITEGYWDAVRAGPDFRAILVPWGTPTGLAGVCVLLGLTVIQMRSKEVWLRERRYRPKLPKFEPKLPTIEDAYAWAQRDWHDCLPAKRCVVPDYVPDVTAGASAPVRLTDWKIKAIKIAVLLDIRGFVTRTDFDALKIDHRRWLIPGLAWLVREPSTKRLLRGPHLPDFRVQHPSNYQQIAADADRWMTASGLAGVQL